MSFKKNILSPVYLNNTGNISSRLAIQLHGQINNNDLVAKSSEHLERKSTKKSLAI